MNATSDTQAPAPAGATPAQELVRPSTLPKLAACRCFENKPNAGPAAARGTMLDAVIRRMLANGGDLTEAAARVKATLTDKDKRAILWAVKTVKELAKGTLIITAEDDLRAESAVPGVKAGTMDTLLPEVTILVDYKSGQIRSYQEQMAEYALSCMDAYFADRWTTVLLFIDEEQCLYQSFSRAEAESIVTEVVNKPYEPTICEYCGWCNKEGDCPARLALLKQAEEQATGLKKLTDKEIAAIVENPSQNAFVARLVESPDEAARWCEMAGVVESTDKAIRAVMRTRTEAAGGTLGRWKVGKPSVTKVVPPDVVGHYIKEIGFDRVLNAYGAMSVKKFEEIWSAVYPDKEPPTDKYTDGIARAGNLTISKPAKPKK